MIGCLDDIQLPVGSGHERTAVTTFTSTGVVGMDITEENGCRESTRSFVNVAISAHIERRDMVFNLANRTDRNVMGVAVVARFAVAVDARMREIQRVPEGSGAAANRGRHVAQRAILARGQMIDRLSGTHNTIVTLRAVTGDAAVAECSKSKARISRLVTDFAVLGCRYMGIELADVDHIIMTQFATRGDAGMIVAS